MTVRTTRAHANIKQTMPDWKIRADVRAMFAQRPDIMSFNECNDTTRDEIRACARGAGYGVLIPGGAAAELALVWKKDRFAPQGPVHVHKVSTGRSYVQPHRYVIGRNLRDRKHGGTWAARTTHTIASGWTGAKRVTVGRGKARAVITDAWRRGKWWEHITRMARLLKTAAKNHDVADWAGDMNRPKGTFKGRPFKQFAVEGAATNLTVNTPPTFGNLHYDYMGLIARKRKIRVADTRTINLHSDHDGIVTVYEG